MSNFKKLISLILCFSIIISTASSTFAQTPTQEPVETQAQTTTETETIIPNENSQNYATWGNLVKSQLIENKDGTLSQVKYYEKEKCVVIDTFDQNFKFISGTKLDPELELYGGFYSDTDFNYIVYGQLNLDQDNTKEVIRIVKYSKDWQRISQSSLKNCNTTTPFDAGSLRMTKSGDMLYINTCHKMYTSSDGLRHQSNMAIFLNTVTMEITYNRSNVSNISAGYVSHSFNQFIQNDGKDVLTVDHGDAYPRSIVLVKYPELAGLNKPSKQLKSVNLLKLNGEIGANNTNASVGGFEISDTKYLVAGNTIDQTLPANTQTIRNIFLTTTDKNNFSEAGTTYKQITNYDKRGNIGVSTPQLFSIGDGSYMLMWNLVERKKVIYDDPLYYITETVNNTIQYVTLDGNGNLTSDIKNTTGFLSEVKPIIYNGKVLWSATNKTKSNFYFLDDTIKSIAVTPPTKTTFAFGQKLDLTGGKMTVTYQDGTTKLLDLKDACISLNNPVKEGLQEVTVTYGGSSTTFNITILKKEIVETITTPPTKQIYHFGEALDLTGGHVKVTYNNDDVVEGDMAKSTDVRWFDPTKEGRQQILVYCAGTFVYISIDMLKTDITSIEMATLPTKTTYSYGNTFSATGGKVRINYVDGTNSEIPLTSEMVTGYNNEAPGTQTLTVTFAQKTTTFDVTVREKPIKTMIVNPPTKTTYFQNEPLDLTGGSITLTFLDDTTKTLDLTPSMIVGDTSKQGKQTLKVKYQNYTRDLIINVVDDYVTDQKIVPPSKTQYIQGQDLDLTDGYVLLNYAKGGQKKVPLTQSMITGYNKNTLGNQTVTITYGETTKSFDVCVIEKKLELIEVTFPEKTEYMLGEAFDLTGGKITLIYNDGSKTDVALTMANISGYDKNTLGTQTVTITYERITKSFEVLVSQKELEFIEVTFPEKTDYMLGEELDLTGCNITLVYNDSSRQEVPLTMANISGYDKNKLGTQTVTITYMGEEFTFDITVSEVITLKGDVNNDGKLSTLDALMIIRSIAHQITLTDKQMQFADYNGDKKVSPVDALLILRVIAGIK